MLRICTMTTYYLQHKYLSFLSVRLDRFTQKSTELWNCRCPFCGDSTKKQNKARGYFFVHDGNIMYKCHNCALSLPLHSVLREIAPDLHKQMVVESLDDRKAESKVSEEKPKIESVINPMDIIDLLQPIGNSKLASDYLFNKRMIPKSRMLNFMFCDNVQKFIDSSGIVDKKGIDSPAIAILCIVDRKLSAVQFRMLEGSMRYLTIKIDKSVPILFGVDNLDASKTVTLVEGPFDSTFVDNCVACTTLPQLKDVAELQKRGFTQFRFVYDSDYANNKQVMKTMRSVIQAGYDVVIYDKNFTYKDLNEAVQNGFTGINSYLDSRTFNGARALLELSVSMK